MKTIALAAGAVALLTTPALAQQARPAAPGAHGQMAKQDYMKTMQDMHQKMMSADDADPDRAFALKMIQHHQGGIAMEQVLQQHGDDAELKQMAQSLPTCSARRSDNCRLGSIATAAVRLAPDEVKRSA